MKLAMAQTIVSTDIPANGAAIRAMIAHAAAQGVRLIGFCEGAFSGYSKFQIGSPAEWEDFGWAAQEAELRSIAALCGELRIFAVVGGAHRLPNGRPPHNRLYIFSDSGSLLTRYDKRFLSNSELGGWYTPGAMPIIVEVDGFRLGCAICIESQFPEVFSDYERMGVDGVIFSSYGLPSYFQIALRAHAGLNCIWIGAATPAQKAGKGPAGIIGPDGEWMAQCAEMPEPGLVVAALARNDAAYDIALQKARPWRAKARQGDIYREKRIDDPRSHNRDDY
ncbi:carbon-nitrogen hydrolase family protein [Pararhizobium sp. BT-229]|uniref:carbon-nitrogen hydrolase family protein n=1 Tax=Pararhizobium sp. BT-229 TaxID=2986923 RepID=UPI0021F6C44F|nr:carbon-nitrogen hydrolase family protein [Pararhizobium sp. BT-229]MCV9960586.1 carbon-nitrogen hydrolase family protein [Pararhizobium sp. BT-229]